MNKLEKHLKGRGIALSERDKLFSKKVLTNKTKYSIIIKSSRHAEVAELADAHV